jgi:hypothetical protein
MFSVLAYVVTRSGALKSVANSAKEVRISLKAAG